MLADFLNNKKLDRLRCQILYKSAGAPKNRVFHITILDLLDLIFPDNFKYLLSICMFIFSKQRDFHLILKSFQNFTHKNYLDYPWVTVVIFCILLYKTE